MDVGSSYFVVVGEAKAVGRVDHLVHRKLRGADQQRIGLETFGDSQVHVRQQTYTSTSR